MPTIFIECTFTYHTDLNTGIQRVVRNVLRHASAVAEEHGYAVCPVRIEGGELVQADLSIVLSDKRHTRRETSKTSDKGYGLFGRGLLVGKYLVRQVLRLIVILLPFDPVRRLVYGPTVRWRVTRALRIPMRLGGAKLRPVERPHIIDGAPGDILLLLDASWAIPGPWPAVSRFKQNGGRVVGVLYDLIPLSHPHDCIPEHVAVFKVWLKRLARVADGFICISQSVAGQLSEYLRIHSPAHCGSVAYFHLGSALDLSADEGEVRPAVREFFAAHRPLFLVIGSIEPRKNHNLILDAFERMWDAGVDASLLIIGGRGWKSDKILDRITNHRELNRRLFLMRDASDTELDFAYRNASALVIASEAEGFGLPVVEAFQRGLPVLCSDIPVFREIADGKARFFGLRNPDELSDALLDFIGDSDLSYPPRRTPQPWLTWRESTEQLLSEVQKILASVSGDRPRTS